MDDERVSFSDCGLLLDTVSELEVFAEFSDTLDEDEEDEEELVGGVFISK